MNWFNFATCILIKVIQENGLSLPILTDKEMTKRQSAGAFKYTFNIS